MSQEMTRSFPDFTKESDLVNSESKSSNSEGLEPES